VTVELCAVVISPTGQTNALGRAICIADLASEVFESVRLYAPDDGPLWQGAKRSPYPVRRFASALDIVAELETLDGLFLVWVIKPLSTSWLPARAIKRALPTSLMVLDVDDADEALSRQFRAASLMNRLRLHAWSPLSPRQIRDTLTSALREVNAVTYASEALRSVPGIDFDGPMLRVPHPRRGAHLRPLREKPRSDCIHLGFLGTVRQHKGLADIEELVLRDHRHRLHVFRGALPHHARRCLGAQVVEHDVDAPMEDVYADIDVVVLPQDGSPGGQAQLPAKLLDAMRFGKPIVASSSGPIVEAAADTVLYVADWGSIDEVQRKIAQAHAEGPALGLRARRRFEERLALEAQVVALREFARVISSPGDALHTTVG
jgi:hypothetical protein